MKKFVLLFFTLICAICVSAQDQDYGIGELKKNLNDYKTLCQKIQEHIAKIEQSNSVLSDFRADAEIQKCVNAINKSMSRLEGKGQDLDSKLAALADILAEKQRTNPLPGSDDDGTKNPSENGFEIMRKYLPEYSLSELYGMKDEVESKLKESGNVTLIHSYGVVFNLFGIQHSLYNRNNVNTYLDEASRIKENELASNEHNNHYKQLQDEIEHVETYRYATLELRRLIRLVSNPDEGILKELRNGQSGSSDNKWAEKNEKDVSASDIMDYLERTNETEYIYKYPYTKKKFKEYVENVGNLQLRKDIEDELTNALK